MAPASTGRALNADGKPILFQFISSKHGVEPSISAADRTRIRHRFESSKVRLLSYGTT
jgi:hypothetical protein